MHKKYSKRGFQKKIWFTPYCILQVGGNQTLARKMEAVTF